MDTNAIPTFGQQIVGVEYIPRPGGYAVIIDDQDGIATVVTPKGRFLPGGAIEKGETAEQAAIRETLEETGLHIRILKYLGRADELVRKPARIKGLNAQPATHAKYYRKKCEFYLAEVISSDASVSEDDHLLDWIETNRAAELLTHNSQIWAINQIRARPAE